MKSSILFMPRVLSSVLITLIMLSPAARGQAQPDALAAARQKFDAGQYREVIQIVAKELAQNRDARGAAPLPQRYDLLMLKAESFLRLDQRVNAADAFAQAQSSEADPKQAAVALANSLLARASPNNKYSPIQDKSIPPIDILNPESRKRAFDAMRADRMAVLAPKLAAAKTATALPPMFEVLKPLLEIASIETAATGSADQTRATLTDLGQHARDLINAELKRINIRLAALEDAANSIEATGSYVSRPGLFSNEADEVAQFVQYLKQIDKTARDIRHQAQQLGYQAQAWEPISADCSDLIDRAQAMLSVAP
jgi:hypothetical protein